MVIMMITEEMAAALNAQVAHEFGAMVQYLGIANYFQRLTLPELSKHFYDQASEEREHAEKFIAHIHDTGAALRIPAILEQKFEFSSVEEAVKASLLQEIEVTNQINALVKLSREKDDYVTENFLAFFVAEQLEEVSSMQDLLAVVQRAGQERLLLVEEFVIRHRNHQNLFGKSGK